MIWTTSLKKAGLERRCWIEEGENLALSCRLVSLRKARTCSGEPLDNTWVRLLVSTFEYSSFTWKLNEPATARVVPERFTEAGWTWKSPALGK